MMIRSAFLTLVLTVSAFAGTFRVTTAPLGDPPDSRDVPHLAAGRTGYLAVWNDSRIGAPLLLAARIAADGSVLDPTGLLIAPVGTSVKVVWNGERHLLFFGYGADLVMRTVDEDGTVGPMRTVVANALLDFFEPLGAATNGERIVVAYAGDKLPWPVRARAHAAVLSMDGTLLSDVVLDETRLDQLAPSVATNGNVFAVAWNRMHFNGEGAVEGFDTHAVRLDAHGGRLDAQPRILGSTGNAAILRPNGTSFLADRTYVSSSVSADLQQTGAPVERPPGRFFTLDGTAAIIDEDREPVSGPHIPRWLQVIRYDGNGHVQNRTRVLQATEDGQQNVDGASAVQRGNDVLIAWLTHYYGSGSRFRLFTTLASADTLTPKTETRALTRSAAAQRLPFVATGENDALVTWLQPDGIYAARVRPDGRRLDGAGIQLGNSLHAHAPVAAYADGRYAVAFGQSTSDEEQWEVVVRFISPTEGLLPEEVHIPVGHWDGRVALASGGGSLVLVWTDPALRATRIHAGGTFDPPVTIPEASTAYDPVVSFNGTHFLIAWVDTVLDWDWLYRVGISGARMTPELRLIDAEPRVLVTLGPGSDHNEPALASNGSDWFLTWTLLTTSEIGKEVRIARIAADGTADSLAGTPLTAGFGSELVWTGTRLMVAWKEETSGNPLWIAPVDDLGARRTLDPSTLVYEGPQVSLARWRNTWAAAYSRWGDPATGHVPRALLTFEGRTLTKRRVLR